MSKQQKQSIKSKLPKEAVIFAKTMGLSLDGLEPEAEDIWNMLDDLSRKDPIQYQQFISEQFSNQKEEERESNNEKDNRKSFRPAAGYSIQTTTIDNDGLKIREVQSSNKVNGKYLYVNICSSIIIENPVDKYGKIIKENSNLLNVMDDISIPLVVGVIRDVVDKNTSKDSLVIDVVFNPIIINLIKNNKNFKTQISELALEWVIKETGLKCDLKWEYCNNGYEYQYGRGDNKDIPVLFFVTLDEKGEPISSDQSSSNSSSRGNSYSCSSSSSSSRGNNRDVLSSPSSLLGQITKEKSNTSIVDDDTTINIDILKPLKSTTKASTSITASTKSSLNSSSTTITTAVESKNKVLIEEVGVSQQQINDVINDTTTQSSPSVPQSTTTSSQPQSSSSSTLPIPPQSSSVSPLSSSSSQPTATTATVKPPSKMEFAHMEQLLGRFDEDYTTPSVIGNDFGQSTLLDTEKANVLIGDLSKLLTVSNRNILSSTTLSSVLQPSPVQATVQSSSTTSLQSSLSSYTDHAAKENISQYVTIKNSEPDAVLMTVTQEAVEDDASSGGSRSSSSYLLLTLTGLMKTLDTSNLDLQISKTEVNLSISSAHINPSTISSSTTNQSRTISSTNPATAAAAAATISPIMRSFGLSYNGKNYQFNALKTVALFKKKKGMLQIKIHYQTLQTHR